MRAQGIRLTSIFLFFLLTSGCRLIGVTLPGSQLTLEEQQLALGNPSRARADTTLPNNYLLKRPQYALSYSRDRGTPNWVSWHVNKDWLGNAPRQNDFKADPALPEKWYRVTSRSYTGSGFDRGHNVPSADRTRSEADNSAVFLMSNIIPQAPDHNQITWAFLEDFTRNQVHAGNEVYVIMGSYGTGGAGSKGPAQTIDQGRITVPARIWKVLVILPEGENDLRRITPSTRVIAVDTPNDDTIKNTNWGAYRTSIDAIEKATGYDLLSNVPKKIQRVIEARVDDGPTR